MLIISSSKKKSIDNIVTTTCIKKIPDLGLIEVTFGISTHLQQDKKRRRRESNKKNTKRWFIMLGNSVKVVNWFLSLSDCHMGTNEWAANLLNWFRGASGCWLMKCGRTKRRLWAAPTHNPSLLFLIGLITPLSLRAPSLGFLRARRKRATEGITQKTAFPFFFFPQILPPSPLSAVSNLAPLPPVFP